MELKQPYFSDIAKLRCKYYIDIGTKSYCVHNENDSRKCNENYCPTITLIK